MSSIAQRPVLPRGQFSSARAAKRNVVCSLLDGGAGSRVTLVTRGATSAVIAPQCARSGTTTILCSALRKERKKLAKVLKSHRKVLEKRLSALQTTELASPVLSELLTELRSLTSQLENPRNAAPLYADSDSSDSSDSDDGDGAVCATRSAATLARQLPSTPRASAANIEAGLQSSTSANISTNNSSIPNTTTMVVSGLSGQVEVAMPAPLEGWDWSEEDFRDAKFDGAGGRVLVCTGSKCQRKGASEVLRAVSALAYGNPNVDVVPCKCVGKCSEGAAVRVRSSSNSTAAAGAGGAAAGRPSCATYTEVRPGNLRGVFEEHFGAGAAAKTPAAAAAAAAAPKPGEAAAPCCAACSDA
ncbi:hypothetical protein Agub_g5683 [Astrephomene gubernaculifera]|uniref:Uncharacterized protein n=1 Tax=Astrephomene gubernaculifera TaxID=47775 RepID=A0AAD3HKZ8_9CHLO|nr:hypothetical protein Agub_g5683 [Astrephomene gubernaculifera]